jgi:hypothetical protein
VIDRALEWITEEAMPGVVGLLFVAAFCKLVWMLL